MHGSQDKSFGRGASKAGSSVAGAPALLFGSDGFSDPRGVGRSDSERSDSISFSIMAPLTH
jgi:hypothetical protein